MKLISIFMHFIIARVYQNYLVFCLVYNKKAVTRNQVTDMSSSKDIQYTLFISRMLAYSQNLLACYFSFSKN